MNKIRQRLHEIQEQLKNDKISKDKKTQLISEAKHLIPIENFDHQKHVIQGMVDDKYSEKKVWDHCQAEIDLLDHFLNENERLKSEALSIEASGGHNRKELQNVIVTLTDQGFELVKRRKTFKDLQTFHCKNCNPDSQNDGLKKKSKQGKAGRKKSKDADPDVITSKVKELIESKTAYCPASERKKEFLHTDGSPKPTTIRDYIFNNHPKLYGGMSKSTLYRRVKDSVSEIDVK